MAVGRVGTIWIHSTFAHNENDSANHFSPIPSKCVILCRHSSGEIQWNYGHNEANNIGGQMCAVCGKRN